MPKPPVIGGHIRRNAEQVGNGTHSPRHADGQICALNSAPLLDEWWMAMCTPLF